MHGEHILPTPYSEKKQYLPPSPLLGRTPLSHMVILWTMAVEWWTTRTCQTWVICSSQWPQRLNLFWASEGNCRKKGHEYPPNWVKSIFPEKYAGKLRECSKHYSCALNIFSSSSKEICLYPWHELWPMNFLWPANPSRWKLCRQYEVIPLLAFAMCQAGAIPSASAPE